MKKIKILGAIAFFVACLLVIPSTANAAGEGSITIKEERVDLKLGEGTAVQVDYSGISTGYGDIAAFSTNKEVAIPCLVDMDSVNKKAGLGIASTGVGTALIIVYRVSDSTVFDFVTVYSGMAVGNEIVTTVSDNLVTTIYSDLVVKYNNVLTGKNGAALSVVGMIVEHKSGMNNLKIAGLLLSKDSIMPGINTFYANFYDVSGALMNRQAVYSRDPRYGNQMELEWSVPLGCTKVVIE